MKILIGSEKGGTGKTTLAVNLAGRLAELGHSTVLVDSDQQGSAALWASRRMEAGITPIVACKQVFGSKINLEIDELAGQFDHVVVDTGGRDSVELRAAMLSADLAIVPLRPSQFDLWTLETMESLVDQVRQFNDQLRVFVAINQAPINAGASEAEEAIAALEEFEALSFGGIVLHDRAAFRKAVVQGCTVWELKPLDKKAIAEMDGFIKKVMSNGETANKQGRDVRKAS